MIRKNEVQVVCVAEFWAKEGKSDESPRCTTHCRATTKEPGCIRYELNQRVDDPRWITYIEKWKDQKTFDDHCQMPYIQHYFDVVLA